MSVVIRGAIISLIAFYLYVFYLMANPNVSAAYREYYILKSTSLSVAERRKLAPLQLARKYDHRDNAIGFDGWSGSEESHRWSNGKSVRLVFKLDAATAAQGAQRVVLHLAPLGIQRTHWRLNGSDLGERQVDGETELAFALKPGQLREGENTLVVELPDARKPGGGDSRLLGIAFKSFRLE